MYSKYKKLIAKAHLDLEVSLAIHIHTMESFHERALRARRECVCVCWDILYVYVNARIAALAAVTELAHTHSTLKATTTFPLVLAHTGIAS